MHTHFLQTMKSNEESSPIPFPNRRTSPAKILERPDRSKVICLTWKDVSVIVPDGKVESGRRQILQGLTGYVMPGEVLAIMGPSGSGKSTLLDALAGRLDSNAGQIGDILVNGQKQALAFGTSAYVTRDDTLMATLTVREAIYYSSQLLLPESMSTKEKKDRVEATIRDMGLQNAIDTRIGGWGVKGISDGEKRRLSICIEILTRPKLLFLDEPTSGLDSAASYHVMNCIVKLAEDDNMSVIASIHQPNSDVFDLFKNLCLLSSGRTIYFGSAEGANEFFASSGFACPSMRNPSDHYLRTINQDFDLDVEQGFGSKKASVAEAIDILVKAYQTSDTFQQIQQYVNVISSQQDDGSPKKKSTQTRFINQCLVLTRRSFVNMSRDLGYYWFRLAMYVALNLCIGTLYYDIGLTYSSIQARGAALMFVATFMTFMSIGGFPSFVEDMKIFSRERLNGHYTVIAFVVANTLSSIPYLLLVTLPPSTIGYYLVGFQRSFNHFAYYALLLFSCVMLVESLMMVVASIVPNFLSGIVIGAGIQGLMILNSGCFRLPNDIPKPFWKYPVYYISYQKYANQGFYKNEFEGLTFPNELVGGNFVITGNDILRKIWQVEIGYSKWMDLVIIVVMMVVYRLMFLGIIMGIEKLFKPMIKAFVVRRKG